MMLHSEQLKDNSRFRHQVRHTTRLKMIRWNTSGRNMLNTTNYLHTHTHPFNGPFSGTTQVSRYQKGNINYLDVEICRQPSPVYLSNYLHSMQTRVCQTVRCPSVCCRFAAVGPAGRCRSIAAAAAGECGQGHVVGVAEHRNVNVIVKSSAVVTHAGTRRGYQEDECLLSICSSSADSPFSMPSMSSSERPSPLASSLHSKTHSATLYNNIV